MPSHLTPFQVEAALFALRTIGDRASGEVDIDRAFHSATTAGRFPQVDLAIAYQLLRSASLVSQAPGRVLLSTEAIELLPLADSTALPALALLLLGPTTIGGLDEARRAEIGVLGEEAVHAWCVSELQELGYVDLISQVRRVSLISDALGYDISAPVIGQAPRMLEVKASTAVSGGVFQFYISRNEYEVGRRQSSQWALVACAIDRHDAATIIGWCRVSEVERYLPEDGNGHWTEARVCLPVGALVSGVPSAVG